MSLLSLCDCSLLFLVLSSAERKEGRKEDVVFCGKIEFVLCLS